MTDTPTPPDMVEDLCLFWHTEPNDFLDEIARRLVARWRDAGLLADPDISSRE